MNKDPQVTPIPIHKPYWGVLARDLNIRTIHKPENFMSLLQAQSQKDGANAVPVSLRNSTIPVLVPPKSTGAGGDRVPGKQKSNRPSKNIPL